MNEPTMKDVARRAGVSKTTVSHVINDTRFVQKKTKERVLRAVKELRYRPSAIARSLATKRTQIIGAIVSDASNHFFAEVLQGIEDILRPAGYALTIGNTSEALEREGHYLDLLMRQRVDGIIAAATSQRWDVLAELQAHDIPVVFVDRYFEGLDRPFVGVDNESAAYKGTKHIIECGHREVGILAGFQRLSTMRERLNGFRQALEDHDIPLPEEWVIESPLSIDAGRESLERLLSLPERPTAVFVSNNLLSLGALLEIKELELQCPGELSVVGFDDHPWAPVSNPPLTVVRQPTQELGQIAARTLLKLIDGERPANPRILLECELVTRESCGLDQQLD